MMVYCLLHSVSQKKELFEFLDSPVHVFNPPRELEAGQDHLHTQGGGTEEEFPVQPETNDGKGEVLLLLYTRRMQVIVGRA